jgi:hypothetical protein
MKVTKKIKIAISMLVIISMLSTIMGTALADSPTTQEWIGWLIDTDCVGANPKTHTQNCNLMPECIASGEGIYVYAEGKAFNTYKASDWLPFDKASQNLAKQLNLVLSDQNNSESYLIKYPNRIPTIKVTGYLVNTGLSPVLADYGDWTTGIHITSIQFYYINGVSNYEVTAPENVVLTEAVSQTATPTNTPTEKTAPSLSSQISNFETGYQRASSTMPTVSKAVYINFNDDPKWRSSITDIKINDASIAGKYEVSNGSIALKAGTFTSPGNYKITVKASGYSDAEVIQKIILFTVKGDALASPLVYNFDELKALPETTINTNTGIALKDLLNALTIADTSIVTIDTTDNYKATPVTVATIKNASNNYLLAYALNGTPISLGASDTTLLRVYYSQSGVIRYVTGITINKGNGISPVLSTDSRTEFINGDTVNIHFADSATWRTGITDVLVNGNSIAGKYNISSGVIRINLNAFGNNGNNTISVKSSGFNDASVIQKINVQSFYIDTVKLNDGYIGENYNFTLSTKDGSAPYAWSAESLPDGLTINPATGIISGVPTKEGTWKTRITANDSQSNKYSKVLLFTINGDIDQTEQTLLGWIIDRDCIGVAPKNHSKNCNLMGSGNNPPTSCYASGLGIYLYGKGGSLTSTNLLHYLVFDGYSRELAKVFLQKLPSTWTNNITVKITGYNVNGIPANATEANVPETDIDLVDHYLKGFHINTIEAAYIEGVSTNTLPDPNVVLPTPTNTPAPSPTDTLPKISSYLTGAENVVLVNHEFSLKYGLKDFSPENLSKLTGGVAAQDILIKYNSDIFDIKDISTLIEGAAIVKKDISKPGEVRIILASTGAENSIKNDGSILELKFRSKLYSIPKDFEIKKAFLADGAGKEFDASTKGYSVGSLLIPYDINGDSRVSLGDLAIAAYSYRKSVNSFDWESIRLADVNNDGIIDAVDLAIIASQIG